MKNLKILLGMFLIGLITLILINVLFFEKIELIKAIIEATIGTVLFYLIFKMFWLNKKHHQNRIS